ncbi:hypothetical protein AK812_SmicGene36303 [Symbiodinium microadriaticum]|uniref:Uncharacterized protein n=1 Tax=Symbiodinium microadriaticum TaxID=2951 RepID=A0A1Q9CJA0_SYMMI|nr:hypothetical protein AK812_SmicGene36303 [Symbiodinium microadriaticum]
MTSPLGRSAPWSVMGLAALLGMPRPVPTLFSFPQCLRILMPVAFSGVHILANLQGSQEKRVSKGQSPLAPEWFTSPPVPSLARRRLGIALNLDFDPGQGPPHAVQFKMVHGQDGEKRETAEREREHRVLRAVDVQRYRHGEANQDTATGARIALETAEL